MNMMYKLLLLCFCCALESLCKMAIICLQEFWVQMVKKACQVSLEYQEIQASVENLDKWATLVYTAKKVNCVFVYVVGPNFSRKS